MICYNSLRIAIVFVEHWASDTNSCLYPKRDNHASSHQVWIRLKGLEMLAVSINARLSGLVTLKVDGLRTRGSVLLSN